MFSVEDGAQRSCLRVRLLREESVLLFGGRPILNDARIRFDTPSSTTKWASPCHGRRILRLTCGGMSEDAATAIIDCEGGIGVMQLDAGAHVHDISHVFIRGDALVAIGHGVHLERASGGFECVRGRGTVAIRAGATYGKHRVTRGAPVLLTCAALLAYSGGVSFETLSGSDDVFRVVGEGDVWWNV